MDHVLDIYDDPTASVLLRRLNVAADALPEKLASAQMLEASELQALPDRLFALVATEGGETLRKYAMNDAPHLATSIAYFLECGHVLPVATQTKVATNLVNACAWYDADPPDVLVKTALLGLLNAGLTVSSVPGVVRQKAEKNRSAMDALRTAQAGTKVAAGYSVELTDAQQSAMMATGDSGIDLIAAALADATPESQYTRFNDKQYENPFKATKIANLTGTDLGAQGALENDPRTPETRKPSPKIATWQHGGDLTGHRVVAAPKVASAEHYALPHRGLYPIDTLSQVKTASAYFDESFRDFTPTDRRVFAQSVMGRAEDLGHKVAGTVLQYGGDGYGSFIVAELKGRIAAFEGTDKAAAYELLLEKQASIPAAVMAEVLKVADAETGVDGSYGRAATGFRDPFCAVYGKVASTEDDCLFSWAGQGHYVSGETLGIHARDVGHLDPLFGPGFALRYRQDPVKTFKALSDSQKVILSRLANSAVSRTP